MNDIECKHGKHKIAFRALKVIGLSRNRTQVSWLFIMRLIYHVTY